MPNEEGRDRARKAVSDALVEMGLTPTEFARRADIDADTVTYFLTRGRWPQASTRNAISRALGWTPASIDRLERGETPEPAVPDETVGSATEDDGVLLSLPSAALEGLGPAEREELIAGVRYRALQLAREIRRRVDDEASQRG